MPLLGGYLMALMALIAMRVRMMDNIGGECIGVGTIYYNNMVAHRISGSASVSTGSPDIWRAQQMQCFLQLWTPDALHGGGSVNLTKPPSSQAPTKT